MFNFPLRKNGITTDGCKDMSNNPYGDAYYHENLWIIVCSFEDSNMGVSDNGSDPSRNLKISGFYTPWFYLNAN